VGQQWCENTHAEDGFGMLVCTRPGKRRLVDFDAALAMREYEGEHEDECPLSSDRIPMSSWSC